MQLEFVWFWVVFLLGFFGKALAIIFVLSGRSSLIGFAIMIIFVSILHEIYIFVRKPGKMGYYGIIYGLL